MDQSVPRDPSLEDAASVAAPAVMATGLVKRYGDLCAIDGIDLEVPRGTIFAILGPNGAGKTTLIRMLATLAKPDGGRAEVMGFDIVAEAQKVRAEIALTGQFASLDEDLTGRENLILLARLWGFRGAGARGRADDLLAAFDLSDAADKQVNDYSGGMRRRLDIAASLVVTPSVLFLDEPTTGLDPKARQDVWRMIRALAASGVTILLSTQYMEEADQLAARIAVIDHGRKIAEGTNRELKAQIGTGMLHVSLTDPAKLEHATRMLSERLGHPVQRSPEGAELTVIAGDAAAANEAIAALMAAGIEISDFALGQPSLDTVFFALTGHAATDEAEPAPPQDRTP